MNRRLASLLCVISITTAGCFIQKDAKPGVGLSTEVASMYVHRGMIQVDAPVFQPEISLGFDTVTNDSLNLRVWGNMDLTDDNGDAWFPQGHQGRFSEVDIVGTYTMQLNEWLGVSGGLFNYILPNGQEFPLDGRGGPGTERGGTTEAFVRFDADVLGTMPYFSCHYDFDEVDGAYYQAGLTEEIPINDVWSIVLDGSVGYASEEQSDWLYALPQAGLADARGKIELTYQYDANTLLSVAVHGSTVIDDDIADWFEIVGILETNPIWFSVGVNWFF